MVSEKVSNIEEKMITVTQNLYNLYFIWPLQNTLRRLFLSLYYRWGYWHTGINWLKVI